MSSKIINDLFIERLIERIKKENSLKEDKEVATLIGLSPQNFSTKKKKGTVVNDILGWALSENKNLDLLFKGEEKIRNSKPKSRYSYLDAVKEWIDEKLIDDPRNRNWFEVEFEKAFQEFKEWRQKREISSNEDSSFKKQANGGGWK